MRTLATGRIFHHGLDPVALEDDDSEDVTNGVTDRVQNILGERKRTAVTRVGVVLPEVWMLDSPW